MSIANKITDLSRRTFILARIAGTQSPTVIFVHGFTCALEDWDALKQIKVLVLVLQSTYFNSELKRVPLQAGMTTPWMDSVAVSVPKSQAKVVPNAGHFTMIDAAQMVSEEIGKFAAAVAKGRRQ